MSVTVSVSFGTASTLFLEAIKTAGRQTGRHSDRQTMITLLALTAESEKELGESLFMERIPDNRKQCDKSLVPHLSTLKYT